MKDICSNEDYRKGHVGVKCHDYFFIHIFYHRCIFICVLCTILKNKKFQQALQIPGLYTNLTQLNKVWNGGHFIHSTVAA